MYTRYYHYMDSMVGFMVGFKGEGKMKKLIKIGYGQKPIMLQAVVGSYIRRDDTGGEGMYDLGGDGLLCPCDNWDKAEFRWPNPNHGGALNVEITGRTIQMIEESPWVRVKLTWVKEDGPDTSSGGWMRWTSKEEVYDNNGKIVKG